MENKMCPICKITKERDKIVLGRYVPNLKPHLLSKRKGHCLSCLADKSFKKVVKMRRGIKVQIFVKLVKSLIFFHLRILDYMKVTI